MGWFDPPHKKLLAKSPAQFQTAVAMYGPVIEAALYTDPAIMRAADHWRAAVIGNLALLASKDLAGSWTPSAVEFAQKTTRDAERQLPDYLREVARQFAAKAYGREEGPPATSA